MSEDERREEGSEMKTEAEIRYKVDALREQWGKGGQNDALDAYVSAQIEALKWALGE